MPALRVSLALSLACSRAAVSNSAHTFPSGPTARFAPPGLAVKSRRAEFSVFDGSIGKTWEHDGQEATVGPGHAPMDKNGVCREAGGMVLGSADLHD
jgi:hypothetical protein